MSILPASIIKQYIGHEQNRRSLWSALINADGEAQLSHHAWIFSGPKGIGKQSLAFLATHYLLNPPSQDGGGFFDNDNEIFTEFPIPDYNSPITKQICGDFHPNFFYYDHSKNPSEAKTPSITIDAVRQLIEWLRLAPAYSDKPRIVMIDGCDLMNNNASNAFLKILEEPPSNCLFLLITNRLSAMPRTILSRSMNLKFHALSMAQATQILNNIDEEIPVYHREILSKLASSSPGRALEIYDSGGLGYYDLLIGFFENPQLQNDKIIGEFDVVQNMGNYQLLRAFMDNIMARIAKFMLTNTEFDAYREGEGAIFRQIYPKNPQNWLLWHESWQKLWQYGIAPIHIDRNQIMTISLQSLYFMLSNDFKKSMELLDLRQ